MKQAWFYCAAASTLLVAVPLAAANGAGRLGTLPLGVYVCSQPGDAGGAAWIELPDQGFTIGNGSTYHSAKGSGIYLLTGDRVTFTRGPMKGNRFQRTGKAALRWLDKDGKLGRVTCIRRPGQI